MSAFPGHAGPVPHRDAATSSAGDPNAGWARVAVLAAGTFAVGTDAFVIAGVLPGVARGLGVTVPEAGQLVTVFALAYAIFSPVLATATGTWPRRRILLAALGIFVIGNVATALAPTFGLALGARIVAACGAGLVTPTSSVVAASLVSPGHRARAIAVATAGLTAATALGAPVGAVIGAGLGWRGTMWFLAGLGALAAAAIWLFLPQVPAPSPAGLRQRLAAAADSGVARLLATTFLMFTGIYLVYTYISVLVPAAARGRGGTLALLLFVFGAAATAGNLAAGHLADRVGPRTIIAAAAGILVITSLLASPAGSRLPGAVADIAVYGIAAFSVTAPQQHRLISRRPADSALVISLNASFLYLAVSAAASLGAVLISSFGAFWLGPAAAAFVLAGLLASEHAHRRPGPG